MRLSELGLLEVNQLVLVIIITTKSKNLSRNGSAIITFKDSSTPTLSMRKQFVESTFAKDNPGFTIDEPTANATYVEPFFRFCAKLVTHIFQRLSIELHLGFGPKSRTHH